MRTILIMRATHIARFCVNSTLLRCGQEATQIGGVFARAHEDLGCSP
jgi:hypothetical protein